MRKNKRQNRSRDILRTQHRLAFVIEAFSVKTLFLLFYTCGLATCGLIVMNYSRSTEDRCNICIFVPSIVFIVWLGIAIFIGLVLRLASTSDYCKLARKVVGPVSYWIIEDDGTNIISICLGILTYCSLVLTVVFFTIKSSNDTSWLSWRATFSPIWLGEITFAIHWLFMDRNEDTSRRPIILCTAGSLLFVTTVLIPMFLDGYVDSSLQLVLIPLWILLGTLLWVIYMVISESDEWQRSAVDWIHITFPAIALTCFLALLCVYADDSTKISLPAVFSPLFVMFSMAIIVMLLCLYFAFKVHMEE